MTHNRETEDEVERGRNVYRLQMGGKRLCEALRLIADGCDKPAKVALDALNHKAPEPDWAALAHTLSPVNGEVERLRAELEEARRAFKRIEQEPRTPTKMRDIAGARAHWIEVSLTASAAALASPETQSEGK